MYGDLSPGNYSRSKVSLQQVDNCTKFSVIALHTAFREKGQNCKARNTVMSGGKIESSTRVKRNFSMSLRRNVQDAISQCCLLAITQ